MRSSRGPLRLLPWAGPPRENVVSNGIPWTALSLGLRSVDTNSLFNPYILCSHTVGLPPSPPPHAYRCPCRSTTPISRRGPTSRTSTPTGKNACHAIWGHKTHDAPAGAAPTTTPVNCDGELAPGCRTSTALMGQSNTTASPQIWSACSRWYVHPTRSPTNTSSPGSTQYTSTSI